MCKNLAILPRLNVFPHCCFFTGRSNRAGLEVTFKVGDRRLFDGALPLIAAALPKVCYETSFVHRKFASTNLGQT